MLWVTQTRLCDCRAGACLPPCWACVPTVTVIKFLCATAKFGEKAGVGLGVIKNIDYDRAETKTVVIDALCRAHNINVVWFETGEGEMFRSSTMSEDAPCPITPSRSVLRMRLPDLPRMTGTGLSILSTVCWRIQKRTANNAVLVDFIGAVWYNCGEG